MSAPVAIITGASAGVGRAIALRLASRRFRVGLLARDLEALEALAREIEGRGGEALPLSVDVAEAASVFAAAQRIKSHYGRLDVWVNDAMETVFSFFEDMTPEEFRRVTEVTYLGFVHGTMAALRAMRENDKGTILQIGSALAYRGIPLQSAYCGAKHAIHGFTESLRTELLHRRSGIRLVSIDLPAVNTPQFDWARTKLNASPRPMGTPIEPEVVADAALRALRGRGGEYMLGWATVLTVLANSVAPSLMDRYLAVSAVTGQERGGLAEPRAGNLTRSVHHLHATRGSFSREAKTSAVLLPANLVRAGVVAAGAAAFFAAGVAISRWPMPRRRLH